MDRVGLGRALGFGARQAARTLLKVVDAAATPSPQAASKPTAPILEARRPEGRSAQEAAAKPAGAWKQARRGAVSRGTQGKGLGKAVWKPMARFTAVLWLEVTGFFYGVIACIAGSWTWRGGKAAFRAGATGSRAHVYLFGAITLVFAYFAVSNFVRARRRERR